MHAKPLYRDRAEAGKVLAVRLASLVHGSDLLVLALPRGGVPVAFEVAKALHAELDVLLVRKLGVPGDPELALGALASGGIRILNHTLIEELGISPQSIAQLIARESKEIERRERLYREGRPAPVVTQRSVILVDDGLATGSTMLAAVRSLRQRRPQRIIAAAPVGSSSACKEVASKADKTVCIATPEPFDAVGFWYEDFTQTSDAEIRDLLDRAAVHPA